jgi:bacterioferritin
MPAGSFTADITAIRKRARQKMEEGPVTGSFGKDPEEVIAGEEEHADDLVDLLGT